MDTSRQLELTAAETVAAIRSGGLGATELVTTLLARARAQSDLNAMILLCEADALAAAARVDAAVKAGAALPPLAGLPIVVRTTST